MSQLVRQVRGKKEDGGLELRNFESKAIGLPQDQNQGGEVIHGIFKDQDP